MSNYLAELEQGLRVLLMQEAEAEAALERARDARKRQEGAQAWEQQRQQREQKANAVSQEVSDGALH
jgi:hypothetical protein